MLDYFITFVLCIICQFAALVPLVTSQTIHRLNPNLVLTTGKSRMFLALGVRDWYPAVPPLPSIG